MECRVALQTLASCVYAKWRFHINQEARMGDGSDWTEGVGLGQIHDIWNIMYTDMKALYTLEQLVGAQYRTRIIEDEEKQPDENNDNKDVKKPLTKLSTETEE